MSTVGTDVRIYIQIATMLIVAISALFFYKYRGNAAFCGRNSCGVLVLCLHIILYYFFVILWHYDVFYLPEFVNSILGDDIFGFGIWSAGIRLQTAIEILLMALTIKRRQTWLNTLK